MAKNEKVVKETTNEKQEAVETKMANEDGKLKVKKKPSMKRVDYTNEPVKVDMSNPPVDETQPKEKEEEVKEKEVKEEEATPVVEEVVEEVKEEVENKEEETEKPVIEEVTEQEVEEKVEEVEEAVEEAVEAAEKTGEELPENIQKVVDFMNETGGDLEDYVKLNQDYSKYDDMSMLREYYKQTKSHLTDDEISFLIEDSFKYDEDVDEERDVKRKKLAFKEQVANAKNHMDGLKSKYYAEIKSGAKLAPEQQKAVDFFNRYNKESKESEKIAEEQRSVFDKQTNTLFNKTFKGFEYNVGDKKYRFNVKDVNKVKETQSDINNFVGTFLDKKNQMKDAAGYHKSLFTAMNADAVANHFYEQGKADGIKESVARSKNIDMTPRQNLGEIETGGVKYKVISGQDSNKFRFKSKNKV
jgi:hypothetical protein